MWAKVRQLTERDKSSDMCTAAVTTDELNDHYAAISTDAHYTSPAVKQTVNDRLALVHITEWRMFTILDKTETHGDRVGRAAGMVFTGWCSDVCQAASRHDEFCPSHQLLYQTSGNVLQSVLLLKLHVGLSSDINHANAV